MCLVVFIGSPFPTQVNTGMIAWLLCYFIGRRAGTALDLILCWEWLWWKFPLLVGFDTLGDWWRSGVYCADNLGDCNPEPPALLTWELDGSSVWGRGPLLTLPPPPTVGRAIEKKVHVILRIPGQCITPHNPNRPMYMLCIACIGGASWSNRITDFVIIDAGWQVISVGGCRSIWYYPLSFHINITGMYISFSFYLYF